MQRSSDEYGIHHSHARSIVIYTFLQFESYPQDPRAECNGAASHPFDISGEDELPAGDA